MNTGRHYELTNETIEFDGHTLHRIICTKSFRSVLKGTLGGFIEGYENLGDTAWVMKPKFMMVQKLIVMHLWLAMLV